MDPSNSRILIVSSLLHPRFGGPATVLKEHIDLLQGHVDLEIVGCALTEDVEDVRSIYPEASIHRISSPKRWYYSDSLARHLNHRIPRVRAIHAHMLWDYPTWAAARTARLYGKRFVVTPHGSFISNWRVVGVHKKVYKSFFLNKILSPPSLIHVLNAEEAAAANRFWPSALSVTIPNPIPKAGYVNQLPDRFSSATGKRSLLFLGRLWKEKGLEQLLRAWGELKSVVEHLDAKLIIAGPDYREYSHFLVALTRSLGVDSSVVFAGMVQGVEKQALLTSSSGFILPSEGEGFSMAILEACAYKLPLFITKECRFSDCIKQGGGFEVGDSSVESNLVLLKHFLDSSSVALEKMGRVAFEFASKNFSRDKVRKDLLDLYFDQEYSEPAVL